MNVAGFEIIKFTEVGSTNDVAADYAKQKAGQRLVITAKRQIAGRGRLGRKWQSLEGNLFFSILHEFSLQNLGHMVMASSLAIAETIKQYDDTAHINLKWPNDVLLNGAKVSGMLLEKTTGNYMIIGIGVNIVQSPQTADILYPATSLKAAGIIATAEDFLHRYLLQYSANMQKNTTQLRQNWLKYAKGIGQEIVVRQNNREQRGIFLGIDDNAGLVLQIGSTTQKILAGDVFYIRKENG